MNVHYDPLAAIMALMVTFVSCIIHLYSVSFMRERRDYVRYFSYLNLFVFSMLVIALADNLIFVYLGWEGVGFCSYASHRILVHRGRESHSRPQSLHPDANRRCGLRRCHRLGFCPLR